MYRKKKREIQSEEVKISLEKLVPENHMLRAIDKAIDFSFIYEEVRRLAGRDAPELTLSVQNRFYPILIRNPFNAPNNKGNKSKCGVPLVHRLFFDRGGSALLNFLEKLC